MKNVLEKILEEIENHAIEFESFGMCDDYVSIGWVKEIIRSHMGEVNELNKKPVWEMDIIHHESYDLGRNIGWNACLQAIQINKDDNWILCSERLPEEHDSTFAIYKDTHLWSEPMFEKVSDPVNVTYEFEDGTRKTGTSYTLDGKWKIEINNRVVKKKVIAWQPLPTTYKGE